MAFLMLVIKGFLIGIAFIIPGVSGGTVAVYLGVYDKLLHAIGHVFSEFKKSIAFLIPIFLGIAISVVGLAKLLGILLDWNSFVTLMFFIGLIIGGIPNLARELGTKPFKASSYVAFALAFILVLVLLIGEKTATGSGIETFDIKWTNFFLILFLGIISSMTMIVPGISGSALLMTLGFYTAIVTNVVGEILDFSLIGYHLFVVIPFALGVAIGIILFSKVIEFLLRKYKVPTYAAIIGFVLASVIVIFMEIRDPGTGSQFTSQTPVYLDFFTYVIDHVWTLVAGLATLTGGFFIAFKFVAVESKTVKNDA